MQKAMIAKHVPPHGDKNHSFQAQFITAEQREKILIEMRSELVQRAEPFKQGDQPGWIMIEFWVSDMELINDAMRALAQSVDAELLYGDFTRKELGFSS